MEAENIEGERDELHMLARMVDGLGVQLGTYVFFPGRNVRNGQLLHSKSISFFVCDADTLQGLMQDGLAQFAWVQAGWVSDWQSLYGTYLG